jgi:hypothetical protein
MVGRIPRNGDPIRSLAVYADDSAGSRRHWVCGGEDSAPRCGYFGCSRSAACGYAALKYLTSGVRAGMLIPDAADPAIKALRVVAQQS